LTSAKQKGAARKPPWSLASPSCSKENPRAEGSFDAGRSSKRLLEDKHPRQKFALTVGRGQFDIKVDAANRLCARWTSNVQGSDGQSPRANRVAENRKGGPKAAPSPAHSEQDARRWGFATAFAVRSQAEGVTTRRLYQNDPAH
jgi:hypothetical protein